MVGHHQADAVGGQADRREAHQRRAGEVEAAVPVRGRQASGLRVTCVLGAVGQVVLAPVRFDVGGDHLHPRAGPGLPEPGPQVGVAAQQRVGRRAHPGAVEGALQVEGELADVDVAGGLVVQVEEEEALLERGEGQDVLEAGEAVLQVLDLVLGERGVGDVGGGEAARAGLPGLLDQAAQHPEPGVGQPLGVLGLQLGAGVGPACAQPGAVGGLPGDGVHVHGVGQRHGTVDAGDVAALDGPRGLVGSLLADLAQVVEAELRHGQRGEGVPGARVEVAQQAVAEAVARYGAQLLLDRLQRPDRRSGVAGEGGRGQPDRVHRREPSGGAAEFGARDRLLVAAVALQVHDDGCGGVLGAAVPPLGDGQGEGAQQHVVDGRVADAGDPGEQGLGGVRVEFGGDLARGRVGVPRGVHVQCARGVAEYRTPVVQLVLGPRLCGQVGQGQRPPAPRRAHGGEGVAGVGGRQVGDEDAPGDAVHDQVVGDQDEQAVLGGAPVEPDGLEHDAVGGGQAGAGRPRLLGDRGAHRGLVEAYGVEADQAVGRCHGARLRDLDGPVVGHPHAQRVVAVEHGPQRGAERVEVEGGGHAQDQGLVELGLAGPEIGEPAHHGGARRRSVRRDVEVPRGVVRAGRFGGRPGQQGGRLVLEDVPHGQDQARRAGAADELDGEDAVAAQVEEAVVHAGRLHAEDLAEQVDQQPLARVAGGPAGGAGGVVGGGQRLAVQLAVDRQRQRVQHDERGRDHVVGQGLAQFGAERGGVDGAAGLGHDVGHEPPVAGPVLADDHGRPCQVRALGDDRLDLGGLDPQAADLDLGVDAPQVLQLAVGQPAHQVAGAVEAGAGVAEGVGHEPLGGQGGAGVVAAGQVRSGGVQLTGHAGRDGAQGRVQHVDGAVGDGGADGRGEGAGQRPAHRGADRGLGGTVGVEHRPARRPALHQLGRDRLGAHDEGQPVGQRPLRQQPEDGGRQAQVGRRVPGRQLGQLGSRRGLRRRHDQGGAGEQAHRQLPERRVETRREMLEDLAARARRAVAGEDVHEAGQPGVGDDDSLGAARRSRGVDHVRGVLGTQRGRPVGVGDVVAGECGEGRHRPGVVEREDGRPGVREAGGQGGRGDDEGGGRVPDEVGDALGGVGRVDGQVGRARLERGERRDDQVRRAGEGDRHEPLRSGAQFEEATGQPVGALVQLAVGQGPVGGLHGEVVRAVGGVPGDVVGEGAVDRPAGGVVPLDQDAVQLPGAEHVHVADAAARIGDQRVQEPQEPLHQQRYRALVEQVRAVLGRAHQPGGGAVGVAVFGEFEGEVQLGDAGGHVEEAHAEAGGGERGEGVLLGGVQAEQHLEERVVGERPGRREDVHQVLEGQVLVVVGAQVGVPHPVEEFPEGGVAAGVGAQHQGVDEEADDLVHGVVAAARHRCAQGDVVARAQPGQQGRQGRLEHHEDTGAGLPGQLHRASVQVGGDGQRDPAAAVRGDRGQRPVRGQFEPVGQPGQRLLPVRELAAGGAGAVGGVPERGPLPQGVVRVLHGQRRPVGGVAGRAGGVGGGQVADQRAEGPAVTGDVVDHQQQDVLVRGEPEQLRAHREVCRQVEAVPGGLFETAAEQVLGEVGDRQAEAHSGGVQDGLPGALRVLREDGPQALVAYDDVLEGRAQRLRDEGTGQPQRAGDVVGGGGAFELVQEPEPLLGVRQGQPLRARPRRQRRPGPLGPVEDGGEPGHGRALEQPPHGEFDAEGAADAGGQPGGEQGVAAEVEEAVVDGQPGHPEHLGEQRAQDLLARAARGASGDLPRVGGGGQRLGVELAVGRQRQHVQGDERRRQHVVGQVPGGVVVQRAGGRLGARDHVRDEPRVALDVLARHHGHVVDGGVRGEHGLDLAGLDAKAADLHLLVGAAQVVQAAVGAAPGQVAGAVHPGAVLAEQGGVRVGGEPVRGERRAAQVAAGQSRAGHVHLAGDAGRGGAQPVVEDVDAQVGDVDADRARRRGGRCGAVQGQVRDVHGGLGDAVHVDQRRRVLGVPFVPVGQPGQVEGLAAEHHGAQGEFFAALAVRGGQLVERGRRLVEDGDPLAGEQGEERGRVPAHVVRDDDEPAAVQQRTPQLPHREVEGVRVEQRPHVVLVEAEPVLGGGEEPHDVAVRHGHALGAAGRAGGVDDVGGVRRVEGPDPLALRQVGGGVRVAGRLAEDDAGHLVCGQPAGGGAVGEQGRGRGVGQRVGEPVGRVARVQRHIGGARLDHREQRHHQLGRARQGEGDQRVGADAARRQLPGQAVGAGVEVGVGERGALEGQRGAARVPGGLPLEQLGQRGGDGRGGSGGAVRPVGRHQQVVVFAGDEHVDVAQPQARVGGDRREQPQQPLGERAHGPRVEEFGAELHREVETGLPAVRVPPLVEGEDEVEAGQPGVHRQQRRADPGQPPQLAQGVLLGGVEGQHHLEQRVVGGGPVGVDRLDEPLEGQVLVGVGGQVALAHAAQQVAEGGVAAGVGAQHQGVDEESDQVLHRRVGAAGDGRADRHVLARAEPRQQPREGGLEHHEDAGPRLAGQRGQRAVQGGGHRQVEAGAGVVAAHGTRAVGGQLQPLRQPGERLPPVRELPGALAARAPGLVAAGAEQFALPERVVGVLHRQRCPVGGRTGRPGGVGGAQVTGEGRQRPAVARDVVQHEEEDVVLGRHPQQRGPQRHVAGEVEAVPGGVREVVGQSLRGAVQRLQAGRGPLGGEDHLVGSVRVLGEDRAQALVPGHHVADGRRQRGLVHLAGQPQRRRDVVQR